MCANRVYSRLWFSTALVCLWATAAADASAQDIVHVYGSEGPFPAIHEAANVFGAKNNVRLDVVSGPASKWLDQARADADVIFASAEFMMSDFIHGGELQIDAATVTPLYMRPSAILVRPGNPKGIHDFPDLLQPGVRVMVVTGSGQTGLWEDMAGKQGDIRTIRTLRKNILLFAANSTEAVRLWRERDDIDAWLTWSIWHLPLHEHADLVPVSDEYVIYRQCNVALTQRGKAKPPAAQFVEFLVSAEGARIFKSWDWLVLPADSDSLTVQTDIAVVCRVDKDEWQDDVGVGLVGVRRLVEGYRAAPVPAREVHVCAVVHGDAAYWMLKDEPYRAFTRKKGDNPNKPVVEALLQLGVSVELCGQTMQKHGWAKEDILSGVRIVPDAYPRIADLQLQGYAYLRF